MAFTPHDIALLKAMPLFAGCAADTLIEPLLERADCQLDLPPGSHFVERRQASPGLHVLVHGTVEVFVGGEGGDEKVIEFVRGGGCVGEETIFVERPLRYGARAVTQAAILRVPAETVRKWVDNSPALAANFLHRLAAREQLLCTDVVSFYLKTAAQRIVCYYVCGLDSGRLTLETPLSVSLPAPKRNLAARLGISPAHFSRALRELKAYGLEANAGNRIVVADVARLAERMCPTGCDL